MAVPTGYKWSREIDPNASFDVKTKMLKAGGRQYGPGQYYYQQGRTYIPQPTAGVRDYLTSKGIYDVGWRSDPNIPKVGGMVTIGGVDALIPSKNVGGKAYADPSDIERAISNINKTTGQTIKSSYEIPEYTSPYSSDITKALSSISSRPSFNYDPSSDEGLQAAQGQAMDAVSRAAARRNMMYSDSNKAQMGTAAMKLIPEFRQQAFGEYAQEGQDLYNELAALSALEDEAYGKYRDTVADTRYVGETKYERDRQAYLDALAREQLSAEQQQAAEQINLEKMRFTTPTADALLGYSMMTPYQEAQTDNMNLDNLLAMMKYNWETSPENPSNVPKETPGSAVEPTNYKYWINKYTTNMMASGDPNAWLIRNKKTIVNRVGDKGYRDLQSYLSAKQKETKNNSSNIFGGGSSYLESLAGRLK